ncbi:MAG TPA: riboflavin synthase [Elusimicrobiota bacterium]|jgi:riboflavin synthase|nr:riboflavin synthase [Elusimicrobiota bacterium]
MFTGIIGVLGKVEKREGARLSIRAKIAKPKLGASVAINGVCLTVVATKDDLHRFEVGPETWARTSLGALKAGSAVNVETSLRLGDEVGGHFVSGHVDAPSKILALAPWDKEFWRLRLELPKSLRAFVAEKGSVAVDGVSLTVTRVGPSWLEIMLVPHTLSRTNLGGRKTGERVNLETDPLARYAVNAVETLRRRR